MHAWKQAREYRPGEPLYARRVLQFSGVKVDLGKPIPERPEQQRIAMWRAGLVDHLPNSPYAEAVPPEPAPVAPPSAQHQPRTRRSR